MVNKDSIIDVLRNEAKLNWTYRNPKPFLIVFFFRITNYFALHNYKIIKIISYPLRIFYRLFIEWFLGVEIPDTTIIGNGLIVHHGVGLVINPKVSIGENLIIRHNTTIGHKEDMQGNSIGAPKLGDNVNIGANVVILGDINIGNNVIIGAGSVVVKDIPANCIVIGNPARVIKKI